MESNTTLREAQMNPIRVSKFAIDDEVCRIVDVANLGHEDGISSSLSHCCDYFFFILV